MDSGLAARSQVYAGCVNLPAWAPRNDSGEIDAIRPRCVLRRQLGERLLDHFDPGPLRRGQLALAIEAAHDVERPGEARARLVADERQPDQADREIGLPQGVARIGGDELLADVQALAVLRDRLLAPAGASQQ